jgi:hypothetical protein
MDGDGYNTQLFDDGSTLSWSDDYGYIAATPSTSYPINSSSGIVPANVNPGSNSWDDVLKFGLSRLIDAGSRGINPTNTYPVLQPGQTRYIVPGLPVSNGTWLLIAAAVGIYLLAK